MLAYEVLTDKRPFEGVGDLRARRLIYAGERPEFPQNAGFAPGMLGLLRSCWHQDPADRPTIDEVVTTWERLGGKENPCA